MNPHEKERVVEEAQQPFKTAFTRIRDRLLWLESVVWEGRTARNYHASDVDRVMQQILEVMREAEDKRWL